MRMIIVFAAVVAVALAAPPAVHVLTEVPSNNRGIDGYEFAYQLSDGTSRVEVADVQTYRAARIGDDDYSVIRVRGSFGWVDPVDGKSYTVTYVADENGFQAQGAHLPQVPYVA